MAEATFMDTSSLLPRDSLVRRGANGIEREARGEAVEADEPESDQDAAGEEESDTSLAGADASPDATADDADPDKAAKADDGKKGAAHWKAEAEKNAQKASDMQSKWAKAEYDLTRAMAALTDKVGGKSTADAPVDPLDGKADGDFVDVATVKTLLSRRDEKSQHDERERSQMTRRNTELGLVQAKPDLKEVMAFERDNDLGESGETKMLSLLGNYYRVRSARQDDQIKKLEAENKRLAKAGKGSDKPPVSSGRGMTRKANPSDPSGILAVIARRRQERGYRPPS